MPRSGIGDPDRQTAQIESHREFDRWVLMPLWHDSNGLVELRPYHECITV